jgi:hypothetical protein
VVDSTEVDSVVDSTVVDSTGVDSVASFAAVGLVGCVEVLSAERGCKISPGEFKADVSTEDFVGLTATSDSMTASAASTDMCAIRTTPVSFTAVTKCCRDHILAIAAWALFRNRHSDKTVHVSDSTYASGKRAVTLG